MLTVLANSGANEIVKRLGSISGGKVLDVCTGSGDLIQTLIQNLKDYVGLLGIDISRKDLESARKRFKGKPVEILEMNAYNLGFKDGHFDTVCMAHSLHHLSDIGRVLAEMKRVLRPGGNLILEEGYCDGRQTEAQKTDMMVHHWLSRVDTKLGIIHNYTLTRKKIRSFADNLGLKEHETLETTRFVKCLSCKNKLECDDPKSGKRVGDSIKEIDDNLERLKGQPDAEGLKEQGEELRSRIKTFGSTEASMMFLIGKKK